MAKMFQVYGIGQALIPVLPPPIPFENAPTSSQTNYEVGQMVYTPGPTATAFYLYAGGGTWVQLTDADGPVQSVTGTANQILASPTTGNVVLSLIGPYTPATYTAHGVLIGEGSSSIVATAVGTDGQVLTGNSAADPSFAAIGTKSGLTAHGVVIAEGAGAFAATAAGSAGQVLVSGGASADPTWSTATFPATAGAAGTVLRSNGTNWVASTDTFPDTATAGDILIATAANTWGSLADVATGQALMSGGVGVAPAYTGSPSFSGSVTAGTTITATSGAITASAGNLVAAGTGNGLVVPVSTASGATPQTANARAFQVTFSSVSIAAGATQSFVIDNNLTNSAALISMSGATSGAALSIQSITYSAATSITIVVTNGTGATTTTADITFTGILLN